MKAYELKAKAQENSKYTVSVPIKGNNSMEKK